MSQRGIRPWSLGTRLPAHGKHAKGNRGSQRKPHASMRAYNSKRAQRMDSFGRTVLGHLAARITIARDTETAREWRKRARPVVHRIPARHADPGAVASKLGTGALINRRVGRSKARKAGVTWKSVVKRLKRMRRS